MNRADRINQCLQKAFQTDFINVEDESHQHHVPENAQTHFKVTLVTAQFDQQSKIARHRQINKLLASEFDSGLHALSLHLYTPEEWKKQGGSPSSPSCRDGYKHG